MMTPKAYLTAVQDAYDRTRGMSHDLAGRSPLANAEEFAAQLALRGLLIVEVPVGIAHDFRGVPKQALES